MKQKALNVAVALAFGAVAAPSLAGTISVTPRLFSSTLFGNTPIAVAPVSYSVAAPLAPNITRYYYIKLSNGAKFDGTKVAAGDFKVTDPGGIVVPGVTIGTVLTSTDGTFEVVQINTGSTPVSINSTITYTPQAFAVTNTGALGTVNNSIAATVSLGNAQNTTVTLADADAASSGPVAVGVAPFTVKVVPSSSTSAPFGPAVAQRETSKIDVLAQAKNGTQFTIDPDLTPVNNALDFGGFQVTLVPALSKADGTPVTNATDVADKAAFTVVGRFSAFVGGKFGLSTAGNDVTFAAANKIPATTVATTLVTFAGVPVTNAPGPGNLDGGTSVVAGTQYFFIGIVDGTTLIEATTPTVSSVTFSLTGAGSATVTPPNGTLYALSSNGGLVKIPTYVPAAAGGGFGGYYRVINTGLLPAAPSVQIVNEDGTLGTVGTLSFVIPPGGVHIYSAADIEAATGPVPAAARPRLQFTATTTIRVQTLLVNPNSTTTTLDTSVLGDPALVSP